MKIRYTIATAFAAALCLAAGLAYAFCDPSTLLAGLTTALPGLMLANGPLVGDVRSLLEGVERSVTSMRERQELAFKELRSEIERVESKGNLQGLMGQSDSNPRQVVRATDAERKAFGMFLKTGEQRFAIEAKAMSVGSNPDGGYAVPTWFDAEVYQIVSGATPLFDLVKRNTVSNFPARHIVSLGDAGAGWVAETSARPATNTPQIAIVETAGSDLYANPQITQWAVDDMRFNAAEFLASEVGLSFAELIQASIVSGNGSASPLGFLSATLSLTTDQAGRPFGQIQYLKTGVAGGLPATTPALIDFLLNVVHSLKQQYRQNASWLMNSTTLGELRKAKDTTNRPVLLDSLISGQPATLLGYPVYEISDMPDLAANALPIALGDWRRGYVLDEHEVGLRVIVDQVTNKPFVGYYSTRRIGGKPLDSNAIKLVKCMV